MRVGEESPAPRGRKKVRKEQMRLNELIDLCAVIGHADDPTARFLDRVKLTWP